MSNHLGYSTTLAGSRTRLFGPCLRPVQIPGLQTMEDGVHNIVLAAIPKTQSKKRETVCPSHHQAFRAACATGTVSRIDAGLAELGPSPARLGVAHQPAARRNTRAAECHEFTTCPPPVVAVSGHASLQIVSVAPHFLQSRKYVLPSLRTRIPSPRRPLVPHAEHTTGIAVFPPHAPHRQ